MTKSKPSNPSSPCGTTTPCPKSSSIVWKKQPGATDEDQEKAKKMWEDAKKRRLPDGSKPDTVKAMEALETSDKTTTINVGSKGNGASPDSRSDSQDPTKGSNANINFNPNKKGKVTGDIERDPESSLAHEAYHGWEYTKGTSGDSREKREKSATKAENHHRKTKELDQREKYGEWDVETY